MNEFIIVDSMPIACSAFIVPLCAISFLAPAETTSENRFVGEEDIEAGGECVDIISTDATNGRSAHRSPCTA